MNYTLPNGKNITIPDKELETLQKKLELSKNEAIQTWLEDNDYEMNEEQELLDEKAKTVKYDVNAPINRKKSEKPHVVKVSDEKMKIFSFLYQSLAEKYGEKVEIVTQNKLITLKVGENKVFKLDLIEQRPKKVK